MTKIGTRKVLLCLDILKIKTRIDLLTFHPLKRLRLVGEPEKRLTAGPVNGIHLIDSLSNVLLLTVLSGNPHIKLHLLTNHSIRPRSTLELLNK